MAKTKACLSVVTATGSAIGNLTSWNLTQVPEEIDASVMGSCAAASLFGNTKTTLTYTAFWDPADTGQSAFSPGSTGIAIVIHPGGTGSGTTRYSGANWSIGEVSFAGASVNDLVSVNGTATLDGTVTTTTTS